MFPCWLVCEWLSGGRHRAQIFAQRYCGSRHGADPLAPSSRHSATHPLRSPLPFPVIARYYLHSTTTMAHTVPPYYYGRHSATHLARRSPPPHSALPSFTCQGFVVVPYWGAAVGGPVGGVVGGTGAGLHGGEDERSHSQEGTVCNAGEAPSASSLSRKKIHSSDC